MMTVLLASLRKEFLLVVRDLHALLVLFVMPVAFILIMTMATQNTFNRENGVQLLGTWSQQSAGEFNAAFIERVNHSPFIDLKNSSDSQPYFHVNLSESFTDTVVDGLQAQPAVTLQFSNELGLRERALVEAAVSEAFALTNVVFLAEDLGYDEAYGRQNFLKQGAIQVTGNNADEAPQKPNATQQNVPAWLVFAMFFVSIPISTTMIHERNQKTLLRLRTMGIAASILYFAKLLPYQIINGIQLVFMLLVGVFVVPLLGGEALNLNVSIPGLAAIGFSVSVAALGYAALTATLCKTTEQATIVSGVGSILFGALGGIMVPKFVMPEAMQTITGFSPMGWGLEGFLDILVRNGNLLRILPECFALIGFGLALLATALFVFQFSRRH